MKENQILTANFEGLEPNTEYDVCYMVDDEPDENGHYGVALLKKDGDVVSRAPIVVKDEVREL